MLIFRTLPTIAVTSIRRPGVTDQQPTVAESKRNPRQESSSTFKPVQPASGTDSDEATDSAASHGAPSSAELLLAATALRILQLIC